VQDAEQYLRFLHEHPYEIDLLFQELLIGVTSFFRDPEAFAFLATTAFPDLVATRSQDHPLRVWVPGCSTGEEAYALAILLRECLDRSQQSCPIQIFATDLHNQAIEKARTGLYPEGIAVDVSRERLERYFVREDGNYRIKSEIRECVVFARQNLLADPPFTKLDLLSCRNLLIYLNAEVQHQLIPLFHYVLNPGGLLFLGSSETVGGFTDLFIPLDRHWKVFRRKESAVAAPLPVWAAKPVTEEPPVRGLPRPSDATLASLMEKLLVQQFAPPSVIVSDTGEIVYIHGLTGLFLQPAPGLPSHNLFTMAREGLRMELIAAVRHVAAHEGAVVQKQVQFRSNGSVSPVKVTVQRLTDPEPVRGLCLVTFQTLEDKPSRPRKRRKGQVSAGDHERVEALERELQMLRETLQSTIEEANTANEELKSTNEELQSTNEELQSANEELETAKEEMQSLNEELQTVNSELQRKVGDLSQINDDMQNLLNSTNIATLFLDSDLRIKRFTPQAKQLFKIIPSDVGRSIGDLVSTLRYGRLQADAQEVLQTLVFKELEVSTDDGKWYAMRIMPYRTSENVIDGVVITFSDIITQKQTERASHAAQRYAESIVETVREALVVLDEELRVVSANRAFYRMFQLSPQEVTNRRLYELNDGQWNLPRLNHLLEDILVRHSAFENFAVEVAFAAGEQKALVLNARRIERATDLPPLILLAIEEMTKRQPGA
jgi:two-component system CheB/CheR fusion protein